MSSLQNDCNIKIINDLKINKFENYYIKALNVKISATNCYNDRFGINDTLTSKVDNLFFKTNYDEFKKIVCSKRLIY